MESITSDSALNDDDLMEGNDNESGMLSGGWCCLQTAYPLFISKCG
jgi:hypothetical protein